MESRRYYSVRSGKNPQGSSLDLNLLRRLFFSVYDKFEGSCYFQEAFGFECVDAGEVPGTLGLDLEARVLYSIRKDDIWPIEEHYRRYTEDDLFDVIEFLYDNVSKPIDGHYHEWNDCGWHYDTFDKSAGQDEFRKDINALLRDYGSGYELSEAGEVLVLAEQGMESLLEAELPKIDEENINQRVEAATRKFRRYRATDDERRDALRDLADVLEYLRDDLKKVLMKQDEKDLFNIANNFGIRHHNEDQKTDYDKPIWFSWMFYYYLATIHAAVRLIEKKQVTGRAIPVQE